MKPWARSAIVAGVVGVLTFSLVFGLKRGWQSCRASISIAAP
jgi:hypothetical protein